MSSIKCPQCGLVSIATEAQCKRCGALLGESPTQNSPVVTEDGYVLPPPPAPSLFPGGPGIWRNKSALIMSKEALLPDRCVKCNQPAGGLRLKRKLSWHHPVIYILAFGALLLYLIVAMVIRKTATVQIGLCEIHKAKRRRAILITWGLVLLSTAGFFAAMSLNDGTYALIGLILLFAAIIYGIVTVKVVAPSKIDDHFVWLKGVNKAYLDQLPQWPGGA